MTTDRAQRIYSVFEQALDKTGNDRAAYLNQVCQHDRELRREVEALLVEADRNSDDEFLKPLPFSIKHQFSGDDSDSSMIGRHLGPYRIDERIGRGGMGNVYLATRTSDFEQRVAIKVIRRGMDTEQVLQRFHDEMQFSAALGKHPHIAAILDGGTTEDGRPFFVMEYVAGERIDRYCDQQQLPLRQRLGLFQQVCSAVQHAHQHTIIHRDLKPSNIMITAAGVPKLIDFGIAKWLTPEADLAPMPVTETAHRFLTPEYASPEQIRGEPLTTGTDVYSLGVVLYELLTGRKPYRLTSRAPADLQQAIESQEPERPSSAVLLKTQSSAQTDTVEGPTSDVRVRRRETPRRLQRMLTGDLDNIVLMALRKEPSRRYSSVEQLSTDIDRFLNGLPVQARKDTWRYRSAKWLRRHRLAVSATAVIAMSLMGGIIGTATQARRAARQAERADAINAFLVNDFVRASDGYYGGDPNMSLYTAVRESAERLKTAFDDQPETKAELHRIVGQSLLNLGRFQEAQEQFDFALGLYEQLPRFGPNHRATIETLALKGDALDTMEAFDEAQVVLQEAWHRAESNFGPDNPLAFLTLGRLGETLQTISEYEQAEPLLRQAHELSMKHLEPSDGRRYTALNSLGELLRAMGRHDESEPLRREFFRLTQQHLGPDHPSSISALNALGSLYFYQARVAAENQQKDEEQRRLAMAEPIFEQLVATAPRVLPKDHLALAVYAGNYGVCLAKLGRHSLAEPHVLNSISISQAAVGKDHGTTEQYLKNSVMFYGDWLSRVDTDEERVILADKWQRQLQRFITLRSTRANHDTKENATPYGWSKVLIELVNLPSDRSDPVETLLRAIREHEPDPLERAMFWGNAGVLHAQYDRPEHAQKLLKASYELRAATLGIEHVESQWMLRELVQVSELLGDQDAATDYRALLASP